jgi:hypothetical protein
MERLREEVKASRAAKAEAAKAEQAASADVTMDGTAVAGEETKPQPVTNGTLAINDSEVKEKERISTSPVPPTLKVKVRMPSPERPSRILAI